MTDRRPNGTAFEDQGGGGPAVVLVHGFGLNRGMWRWQRAALSARYRLITYDLFGHGESAPPPGPPDLALFSEQLLGLLDRLSLARAAVVGFSLGGMIARRFAMDHPERLWGLAILNSAHMRDDAAQQAIRDRVALARAEGPGATVEAALTRWFGDAFRFANPQVMELVRGWLLANDPSVYAEIYAVLAEGVGELIAPKPPIACPTLVLTGDQDYGNSPEMTQAIAAEIPDARSIILPGLRHMAMVEAPEPVNRALLAFLNAHAPGGLDG